jgi:hypothetical protein
VTVSLIAPGVQRPRDHPRDGQRESLERRYAMSRDMRAERVMRPLLSLIIGIFTDAATLREGSRSGWSAGRRRVIIVAESRRGNQRG